MNVAISQNLILNMRQESYVCLSVCLSFWLALSLLSLSVSLVFVCLSVSPFLSFPFAFKKTPFIIRSTLHYIRSHRITLFRERIKELK